MSNTLEVKVPNIGDFSDVEIIEVLVSPGDRVAAEDSLITLESDKASIEIPSPQAGVVKALQVKIGDTVNEGSIILTLEAEKSSVATEKKTESPKAAEPAAQPTAQAFEGDADSSTEVLVLGSGPGGYTAAFRAADLGKKVTLVERYETIGGVCLNVGCIPSKALLHVAEVITEAKEFKKLGVEFSEPKIDIKKLKAHKDRTITRLTGGLKQLAKQRGVTIAHGYGKFTSAHTIEVEAADKTKQTLQFEQCIIAAGSSVTKLPFIPWDDPRVMDSTDALALQEVPENLLVMGGGIIGLEMATVYHALGSKVTVVELANGLMPGADRDLVKLLERDIKKRYEKIYTGTKVTEIKPEEKGLLCKFEGG